MRLILPPLLAVVLASSASACSVFLVGKDASSEGSSMVTHSNDGEMDTDPRLVRIPAKTYTQDGDKRPVYFTPEDYPRYVGTERGLIPEYFPTADHPTPFEAIGTAPNLGLKFGNGDAATTFAYLEDTYGVVNEAGLAMGESTCSGVFGAVPLGQKDGTALWSIDQLTQIAMERAATAREAVQLMGELAEYHGGFYGAGQFEGTAESLAITDSQTGEGWLFHILPDPTGTSAIWAAQRIPTDGFAVLANMFVIREIDPDDTANYLMSDNVHSVATDYGWYDADTDGLLDFTKVYSDGEYSHKYYSGRRMWGAYRLVCPEVITRDDYVDLQSDPAFPVYCKANNVAVQDIMALHREYYAGTKYDLTKSGNLGGGAFSSPDRWKEGGNEDKVGGAWERAIAMFRTSDTFIVQTSVGAVVADSDGTTTASPSEPVLWYGPSAALSTVFTPFTVSMPDIPATFRSANPYKMERTSAFWATTVISNISNLKWSYMIQDIRALQSQLESASVELVKQNTPLQPQLLLDNAQRIVDAQWQLSDQLLFKYANGFINEPDNLAQIVGYPEWWLESVEFVDGPPPPPTDPKCCNPEPVKKTTTGESATTQHLRTQKLPILAWTA